MEPLWLLPVALYRLHVTSVLHSDQGSTTRLVIQGENVPAEGLVAFTYRQGGIILLNPIEIKASGLPLPGAVDLPLVAELTRTGLKVEKVQFQLESQN